MSPNSIPSFDQSLPFPNWEMEDSTMDLDLTLEETTWDDEIPIFQDEWRAPTDVLDLLEDFGMDIEDDVVLGTSIDSLPFDKRFEATYRKLSRCMKRSQETRQSLTIKTNFVEDHLKQGNTKTVVESVSDSAQKLQTCLTQAPVYVHAKQA